VISAGTPEEGTFKGELLGEQEDSCLNRFPWGSSKLLVKSSEADEEADGDVQKLPGSGKGSPLTTGDP